MKTPKIVKKALSSAAYEVGYGKPPKSGQFKPGRSGNPKGRPRRQPTTEDLFLKEAARLIGVRVGDQIAHVSRREALVRRVFQMGLEGNPKLIAMLVSILFRGEAAHAFAAEAAPDVDAAPPLDEETLRRMFERFQHLGEPGKES